jgi:hypothetical protein
VLGKKVCQNHSFFSDQYSYTLPFSRVGISAGRDFFQSINTIYSFFLCTFKHFFCFLWRIFINFKYLSKYFRCSKIAPNTPILKNFLVEHAPGAYRLSQMSKFWGGQWVLSIWILERSHSCWRGPTHIGEILPKFQIATNFRIVKKNVDNY